MGRRGEGRKEIGHEGKTAKEGGGGLNSAFCHFQSGCQEERNCPVAKAGLRECG